MCRPLCSRAVSAISLLNAVFVLPFLCYISFACTAASAACACLIPVCCPESQTIVCCDFCTPHTTSNCACNCLFLLSAAVCFLSEGCQLLLFACCPLLPFCFLLLRYGVCVRLLVFPCCPRLSLTPAATPDVGGSEHIIECMVILSNWLDFSRLYLLGLLAMIKCSICSYQCDN